MKAKKILIPVLLILAATGFYFGWKYYIDWIRTKYTNVSVNSRENIVYDATEEIQKANANYEDSQFNKKSKKTQGYKATQHKVSLVFAGLTTPTEMQKIMDLLLG